MEYVDEDTQDVPEDEGEAGIRLHTDFSRWIHEPRTAEEDALSEAQWCRPFNEGSRGKFVTNSPPKNLKTKSVY